MKAVRQQAASDCELHEYLIEDIYPCTPPQEAFMALSSKSQGEYILKATMELSSEIQLGALRLAWEMVVRQMEILRSRIFHHEEYGFLQVVSGEAVQWDVFDDFSQYEAAMARQDMTIGSLYRGLPSSGVKRPPVVTFNGGLSGPSTTVYSTVGSCRELPRWHASCFRINLGRKSTGLSILSSRPSRTATLRKREITGQPTSGVLRRSCCLLQQPVPRPKIPSANFALSLTV